MEKFLDVIEEFNDNQKEYLALRVMGFEWKFVMMLIGLSQNAISYWKGSQRFLEVESLLVANKKEFLPQVQDYFNDKMAAIDYSLLKLASKIVDWDNVEKIDKPYIMKAVEMVKKRFGVEEGRKKKDGWLLEEAK